MRTGRCLWAPCHHEKETKYVACKVEVGAVSIPHPITLKLHFLHIPGIFFFEGFEGENTDFSLNIYISLIMLTFLYRNRINLL